MTSMPASRRARAITLAPRSWPSRPGLATSTRILRSSAIEPFIKPQTPFFTTEGREHEANPLHHKGHEGSRGKLKIHFYGSGWKCLGCAELSILAIFWAVGLERKT